MHQGQLLKRKLEEKPAVNKAEFAREFGYKSKKSLYNAFDNPEPDLRLFAFAIKRYGRDFSKEMPDLRKDILDQMNEDITGNTKMVPLDIHLDLMKKYTAAVEENNQLLTENIELYRKLGIEKPKKKLKAIR